MSNKMILGLQIIFFIQWRIYEKVKNIYLDNLLSQNFQITFISTIFIYSYRLTNLNISYNIILVIISLAAQMYRSKQIYDNIINENR